MPVFKRRKSREISRRETQRSHLTLMGDEDLMEQFQKGSVESFNILVERFSGPLMRYLNGFSNDIRLSEDLLQETFIRVYRNRHSYRRIAKFSTWIYTIAGNLARSEYRKRRRTMITSIHAVSRDNEEYEVSIPDAAHGPDELAEGTLQRKSVMDALSRLPVDFREVVVLRDIQQLAYEEIADITGLPMGTVKSRINRGRSKLQEMLKDVYPFDRTGTTHSTLDTSEDPILSVGLT